jgi:hypothetical protein
MKKFFSYFLFVLAVIWSLMTLFKFYLAATGYVDMMGRTPSSHVFSGFLQGLLAFGAYKWAMFLRRPKDKNTLS